MELMCHMLCRCELPVFFRPFFQGEAGDLGTVLSQLFIAGHAVWVDYIND